MATSRRRSWSLAAAGTSLVLSLTIGVAAAHAVECDPGICAGQTCTIGGMHKLAQSCVLDFSGKDVTIAKTATLSAPAGASLRVQAASLHLLGQIKAARSSQIAIQTSGDFEIAPGRGSGSIVVLGSSTSHGSLQITAGGDAVLAGKVSVAGTDTSISIDAATVTVAAELSADCVAQRGGISLVARSGSIQTTASVHANVKGVDPSGQVLLQAAGDIDLGGPLLANGGSGGTIQVTAGGDLTVHAGVSANGGRIEEAGGGSVQLLASGDVDVGGTLSARSIAGFGIGGNITITPGPGGSVSIDGVVDATSRDASYGTGGNIVIGPACSVRLAGMLDTQGAPIGGSNAVIYRTSFDATGGAMFAGQDGSNVQCRCAQVRANGTCAGGCAENPIGLGSGNVVPAATLIPTDLSACGS